MRTTLDLDDRLLKRAKHAAVERGATLTRFIEDAIRTMLEEAHRQHPFRLDLLIMSGPGELRMALDMMYEAERA